jgi:hypothetical protein
VITPAEDLRPDIDASQASGRDRRIHPRLSPEKLSIPASIRIPNRPAIALVDLSPGGALIDLPFQIRPDARLTVELRTASEQMMLPFRLLRCYVTSLRGGVRYQAAGAFENGLDWKPLLSDVAAHATTGRLIATLEAFLRHSSMAGRVVEFDQMLMWILDAAQRGERAERIAMEIRQRLGRLVPSLVIEPSTRPTLPDPAKGARFFGLDFRSERPLTTSDRRLLRASAQLLSIVKGSNGNDHNIAPSGNARPSQNSGAVIAYSIADWQDMCNDSGVFRPHDPWRRSA